MPLYKLYQNDWYMGMFDLIASNFSTEGAIGIN